ncbi:hypothetical protein ACKKBG_A00710 [Auxenochlorella protothecoides x Auxenochlorella symbiontica]
MAESVSQALLVVDMQNDFLLPSSPVCVAGGMDAVPAVMQAVQFARENGVPVIWVLRAHHHLGVDVEISRKGHFSDGAGVCVYGTPGASLVAGLQADPQEIVIHKQRFSGFMCTELDLVLRRLGVTRVTICGVQTPNCIRATAFDAVALGYAQVEVLSDATASASKAVQAANLYDLRQVGVCTPSLEEWASGIVAQVAAHSAI